MGELGDGVGRGECGGNLEGKGEVMVRRKNSMRMMSEVDGEKIR